MNSQKEADRYWHAIVGKGGGGEPVRRNWHRESLNGTSRVSGMQVRLARVR